MIMATSLKNFEPLTAEFPHDRDAILRLATLIDSAGDKGGKVYSVKRIYDAAHFSSQLALAKVLHRLVQTGVFQKIIRVEFDSLGGVKDFSSIEEVPEVIHDWRRDIDVVVQPQHLHVLYQVTASK